jgi:hypothetical protein
LKNLFILFFGILFLISSSSFAQVASCPSADDEEKKLNAVREMAKTSCGSGEFASADSFNYDIDWTAKDKNLPTSDAQISKALGSLKCGYLLTVCTTGSSVKVGLFVDYISTTQQTFNKVYTGQVSSSNKAGSGSIKSIKLDKGEGNLVWSYGSDTEKKFSKDINKFKFMLPNENIVLSIFESFFIQSKRFRFEAGVNCIARQEIIMPMPGGDDEDDDEANAESSVNSSIDSKATLPEKLEKVAYAYNFMFLKVGTENTLQPYTAADLKSHGVYLENLDDFPKDKNILMAFIGIAVMPDHIEMDVFALLTDPKGDALSLYDFTQAMFSVQTTVKAGLNTEKGSLDDIMVIFERENFNDTKRSLLAQRKATKGGMDVIDVADGKAKVYSGTPWTAKDDNASTFKTGGTKVAFSSVFRKTSPTSPLNLTDEVSGLKKTFLKAAINRAQKKWVNELLGK